MQKKYILGIDIGGTNFRTGLVSESYTVEDFRIKPSLALQSGDFIKNLSEEIKDYINKYNGEPGVYTVVRPEGRAYFFSLLKEMGEI